MDRTIKVVYMIDTLGTDLAGTENQLIKMINGLDKKRFEVSLVCFNNHPWLDVNASRLKCSTMVVEINRFKRPYTYLNFLMLVRYLRSHRPDIVQTFFPAANIVGVLAARLAGVKNIVSSRRDYGEWMNGRYLLATRFSNRFVTKIIANSKRVKELTETREGVEGSKIDVIYNGIDTRKFRGLKRSHQLKKSLNIPGENKVAGIIANFRPMKHHDTFIKAAREVLKKRTDVNFILVGAGPLKESTERLASELGIAKNVHFAGAQKDVMPYLSVMDIGVNCSEGEGLSNAVMEYMSAGIPCVVSDAGGNPDLITNGVDGYTFKLDDHLALSSLIEMLIDDKAVRDRVVKNALEKIERNMSLAAMLKNHETCYEKLVYA